MSATWQWAKANPDSAARRIRELERENAALQDAIEESEEFARKNGETCGSKIRELLRENAALREAKDILELERCEMMRTMSLLCNQAEQLQADKERLDWLLTGDGGFWVNWMYEKDEWTPELKASRDAIDACRNWRIGNGRQP